MEPNERDRQQALTDIRKKIQVGYDQLSRGETVDPDEVFEEIQQMSKAARMAAKKPQ